MVDEKRIRKLNKLSYSKGEIVYWMSRDQRMNDNYALLFAEKIAREKNEVFCVAFCLVDNFLNATTRQYDFMLKGLEKLEKKLKKKNIPFHLLIGDPTIEIPKFVKKAGCLITDFDPLKIKRKWKKTICQKIKIPFFEVDTHNIVPCFIASSKEEFGAYTLRPKINKLLPLFLKKIPKIKKQKFYLLKSTIDWNKVRKKLQVNKQVDEVFRIKSGEDEAIKVLRNFIKHKLKNYAKKRNDPNLDGTSNLSAYLHFGQLSSQRVAYEIKRSNDPKNDFLEELIIRKELSDNFCFFNKDYDNFKGLPLWSQKTLNMHKKDKRPYLYSKNQFEEGKTHDDLWNAAQMQLVIYGKMHGYMRMYWAKKILQWTRSPEEAFKITIYLNDKYELDGRDPNGYAGIAWSLGGKHDRPWPEREVFGKIRYMTKEGCGKKFDLSKYIATYLDKLFKKN